jgi:hypothetical protein
MKKVIILNGSPRKNFNTAQLLKEAQKGAESVGAEVEYVDLVDLNFKGCMSCFACKRKGVDLGGLCAIKDDLRPVLERIVNADAESVSVQSPYHFLQGIYDLIIDIIDGIGYVQTQENISLLFFPAYDLCPERPGSQDHR